MIPAGWLSSTACPPRRFGEWEQARATELERRTAEYERTGEAYSIDEAFDRAMARMSGQ